MSDCDRFFRPEDVEHLAGHLNRGGKPALHLIEPDLGRVSGGLRYNESLAAGADELLRQTGVIQRHSVPGTWPHPSAEDEATVHELAATLDAPVVVDGLIGSALSTPLDLDVPVIQLLHAILGESDPAALDRERTNMHAADAVVTTSPHSVKTLKQLTGIWASVAMPGVDLKPVAQGSPRLNRFICVGAVEPNKNQLFLTEVFSALAARDHHGHRRTDSPRGRRALPRLRSAPAALRPGDLWDGGDGGGVCRSALVRLRRDRSSGRLGRR